MTKEMTIAEKVGFVSDIAVRKSGTDADKALMDIAESGDEHAIEVLRDVPPHVKARIVREHDFTKPSFVGMLSSPEDVAETMAADPSTWLDPNLMLDQDIETLLRDIADFVTGVILTKKDEEWHEAVFNAIAESDEAMLYLAVSFIGHVEFSNDDDSFVFNFSYAENCDGEIGHLHRIMRECTPNVEQRIGSIVYVEETWKYKDKITLLSDLHASAKKNTGVDTSGVDDMMEDL